jgi:hypothetical protein
MHEILKLWSLHTLFKRNILEKHKWRRLIFVWPESGSVQEKKPKPIFFFTVEQPTILDVSLPLNNQLYKTINLSTDIPYGNFFFW